MLSLPANLGIVAYARVRANGSTPYINSGVTVRRVSKGQYEVTLPGAPAGQEPLQEGQQVAHSDLIFLTPILTPTATGCVIDEPDEFTRVILFTNNSGQATDTEFNFLMLRVIHPIPVDANGNQLGPV